MTDKNKDVVISTRVRFARNINGLPFPHKLSGQEEIYSVLMKNTVDCCNKLFAGKFYKTGETEKLFEQSLVEKHLISAELVKKPYGGVFVADDETVSIMINEEDHIREQCIMPGYDLDNAYAKLVKLDELLAQNLDIAYDKYFGYLTACPTNLGAAMRLSALVSLPAMTIARKMGSLISGLEKLGFTTRGTYGEGTDASGFEYQISNQAAVGKSEESIKDIFGRAVTQIIELERREREALKQRGGVDLKDKIAERFIDNFEQATGIKIKDSIEEIEVATPLTYAHYTSAPAGTIYGYYTAGLDNMMARLTTMYDESPLKGLRFAGGHAMRSSGYNSSYLSGDLVAKLTMGDMKEDK